MFFISSKLSNPAQNLPRILARMFAGVMVLGSLATVHVFLHMSALGQTTFMSNAVMTLFLAGLVGLTGLIIVTRERYLQTIAFLTFAGASFYITWSIYHGLFIVNSPKIALQFAWWMMAPYLLLFATHPRNLSVMLTWPFFLTVIGMSYGYIYLHDLNITTDPAAAELVMMSLSQAGTLIVLGGLAVYRDAETVEKARAEAAERESARRDRITRAALKARRRAVEARHMAEQARIEMEAALATRDRFMANVSHELRTPLNAINGFSEILMLGTLGAHAVPKYREYAEDIHTSGTHLLSLIDQLLDYSRLASEGFALTLGPVDLGKAATEAVHLLQVSAQQKKVRLSFEDCTAGAGMIEGDARAIRQIIINLTANAIKFTPEGGKVDVMITADASGDISLSVADTGVGIPDAVQDQIFEPFARAERPEIAAISGTGLGLAIVKGLVEAHGARITLDSEPGRGATFTVFFPSAASLKTPSARADTIV